MGTVAQAATPGYEVKNAQGTGKTAGTGNLAKYCVDKVQAVRDGQVDAVIGFENRWMLLSDLKKRLVSSLKY